MSQEYIDRLDAQSAAAVKAKAAAKEQVDYTNAFRKAEQGLTALNTVLLGIDMEETRKGVLDSTRRTLLAVLEDNKPASIFDRTEGDALVGALNNLLKIPGMVDEEKVKHAFTRWMEAIDGLPKTSGGGGSSGTRTTRDKVDFTLTLTFPDGKVKSNRPAAGVNLSTQVNEARYQFGYKSDAVDLTDALKKVLSGEATEVDVHNIGKVAKTHAA